MTRGDAPLQGSESARRLVAGLERAAGSSACLGSSLGVRVRGSRRLGGRMRKAGMFRRPDRISHLRK